MKVLVNESLGVQHLNKVKNHWSRSVVFNLGVATPMEVICLFSRGRTSFW